MFFTLKFWGRAALKTTSAAVAIKWLMLRLVESKPKAHIRRLLILHPLEIIVFTDLIVLMPLIIVLGIKDGFRPLASGIKFNIQMKSFEAVIPTSTITGNKLANKGGPGDPFTSDTDVLLYTGFVSPYPGHERFSIITNKIF